MKSGRCDGIGSRSSIPSGGTCSLRELWVSPGDHLYQFFRWTWGWHDYLTLLCNMKMHDSVLELACNHGRTMLGLLAYLKPPGRYEGLDILPEQIEYAQQHIHPKFAHFNFTLAGDLYNSVYNPRGRVDPADYRFPYDDSSFDIIYAASLFTHLVPPVTANYLQQSRRILRERAAGASIASSSWITIGGRGLRTGTSSSSRSRWRAATRWRLRTRMSPKRSLPTRYL